jgi:hypothetical protein
MAKLTLAQRVDQFLHEQRNREKFGVQTVLVIEGSSNLRWVMGVQTETNGPYQIQKSIAEQLEAKLNYGAIKGQKGRHYFQISNPINPEDKAYFEAEYQSPRASKLSAPADESLDFTIPPSPKS